MAGALVGGALLSAFLQVAFDRLASRDVVDYFRTTRLDQKLLDKLNVSLLFINAVVDDAEEKQISNKSVRSWLDLVKDAVLDVDDLLDEIHTVACKRKLEAESQPNTSKVWSYFSTSFSSFDRELESRIKEILDKLEFLASKKEILGLKERSGVVGLGNKAYQRLPTTSLVGEAVVYGRDDEKSIIIDLLLSHNESANNPSVICIVGMGGMGKTTLAQLVYNDHRLKDEFDLTAWICVSEEFDVVRITRTVLEAIDVSTGDTKDLDKLQVKLKEKLTGKKFLFVFDDMWNENYLNWEALQAPFIYGARGSKILVTTRSEKVASIMRRENLHRLKQLLEEDSWLLFAKHALRDADPQSNSGFEEIGRKIVKKCQGLPLALKSIGSLLYTKLSYEEWNRILTSEIWDMQDDEGNIIPALRLSYHYLPSHLKRCFAYCSIFPKDFEFDKDFLVQLWMAENLLQSRQQNMSVKELVDQWFDDLLSRSFFQSLNVERTWFVMHDLVNDLAKYVSGEFCLRLGEHDEAKNASKMTRHFSYVKRSLEASKRFEALHECAKLRTFLPLDMDNYGSICRSVVPIHILHMLSNLKFLRVLRLSGYCHMVELPNSIIKLIHLRYLDLSYTGLRKLPNSICLLYNLQILKLADCDYLEELPSEMHKLINLCHLDFSRTKVRKVPNGLGKLKNLEVLSSYYVGKGGESNINELAELNLRGTLRIGDLQNVAQPVDALAANLKNKVHIKGLSLQWSTNGDGSQIERDVLENLKPHKNLEELTIQNYSGTRFPDWFEGNSLSNIVSLNLFNCKYCLFLPALGLIPSLKYLSIKGLDGVVVMDSAFLGNNTSSAPFGSLQVLSITEMAELEEWECQTAPDAFPCLKELNVANCPKLKKHLPRQLPSLRRLSITNCEQLAASLPLAPAIDDLYLKYCGNLNWESPPSTLKILHISGGHMDTSLLEKFQERVMSTCLTSLKVTDCPDMEFPIRHSHAFLETVQLSKSCHSLRMFPLDFFPRLKWLELNGCRNLEMFSISEGHHLTLTSLTSLNICDCPKLVSFPKEFSAPNLKRCYIKKMESLKSLPEEMHVLFPSLESISLDGCPELESFPEGGLASNLKRLYIYECPKLIASAKEWNLDGHTSLFDLDIKDAHVESFPNEGVLPPTLEKLCLRDCSNLQTLEGLLPSTLGYLSLIRCSNLQTLDYRVLCHLSSLKSLYISDCPRLQCLPKEGLPRSLSTLEIDGSCPLLKQRCQKQSGEDWNKIAHINCVVIDEDIIT